MLPLVAWTYSVLPVYVVWDLSRHGQRWMVPGWVMATEFGAVLMVPMVHRVLKGAGAKGAMVLRVLARQKLRRVLPTARADPHSAL